MPNLPYTYTVQQATPPQRAGRDISSTVFTFSPRIITNVLRCVISVCSWEIQASPTSWAWQVRGSHVLDDVQHDQSKECPSRSL